MTFLHRYSNKISRLRNVRRAVNLIRRMQSSARHVAPQSLPTSTNNVRKTNRKPNHRRQNKGMNASRKTRFGSLRSETLNHDRVIPTVRLQIYTGAQLRICLILCWLFILTLPDIALAQSKIDVPVDTALEHLEIPKSFPKELVPQASFRIEIADQKAGGLHAIYANRASGDGIHIITEYGTDRSSSAARRASAKAYLNSTVQKYAAAGFKVVKMLPGNLKQQFDGLDFSKEQ